VHQAQRTSRTGGFDVLLTTEKDGVKLANFPQLEALPIYVLKIAIDFLDDGGTILHAVLDRTLQVSEPHDASVQTHRPVRA
jgi:tetraacyldisaccharide-1-P 4'-kinase